MALDAENSIPIIFVDQIICNSNFLFFFKSTNKMWARRRRRRIYVLGCLGVWWGLEKEISGIIEYGALNE